MAVKKTTRLDQQGRVILPSPIRDTMGLKPGDKVDVALADDGSVRISSATIRCALCGTALEAGDAPLSVTRGTTTSYLCRFCCTAAAAISKEKE